MPSVGSRMAAEGQEVTAGAAAVLARRKDRPPLPRSLREAANEETSDEEWCAAEEQCEEDHETRVFLPASKYGRVRIHQAPRAPSWLSVARGLHSPSTRSALRH